MSVVIGVKTGSAIHVLTDAAVTSLTDGVVSELNCKQLRTRSGVVVAAIGLWPPTLRFVLLADERTQSFDELVAAAPEFWDEARSIVPARLENAPHGVLLAGWSHVNERLEMHVLHAEVAELDVFAAGPGDNEACQECLAVFIELFRKDPHAFDARRDGIDLMQEMRRHHQRQFELAQRAVVGGFVTHAIITRDGVEARVIHEWPDKVGEFIDAEIVGSSVSGRGYRLPRLLEALLTRHQRMGRSMAWSES